MVDLEKCWYFAGSISAEGYGIISGGRNRPRSAHRAMYEALIGLVPDGLHLDHLCRVRHCINPEHLEPVTPQVNTLRGEGPAAINARKTHCPQGHEYNKENTKISRYGFRECIPCQLEYNRAQVAKKTKCIRGHDLSDAFVTASGTRRCRRCPQKRASFIQSKRRLTNDEVHKIRELHSQGIPKSQIARMMGLRYHVVRFCAVGRCYTNM